MTSEIERIVLATQATVQAWAARGCLDEAMDSAQDLRDLCRGNAYADRTEAASDALEEAMRELNTAADLLEGLAREMADGEGAGCDDE